MQEDIYLMDEILPRLLITAVIIIVVGLLDGSCGMMVDQSEAICTMENQGYTDVKVTDKSIFFLTLRGCGSGDAAKFDVTATNPAGKQVNMFVCAGWPFKGATTRSY